MTALPPTLALPRSLTMSQRRKRRRRSSGKRFAEISLQKA
jgi:hypothetical protein